LAGAEQAISLRRSSALWLVGQFSFLTNRWWGDHMMFLDAIQESSTTLESRRRVICFG